MLDRGYADQVWTLYKETHKGESFQDWLKHGKTIIPQPKVMALAVRLAMVDLVTQSKA